MNPPRPKAAPKIPGRIQMQAIKKYINAVEYRPSITSCA
jgi:hypothetical protein